MKRIMVISIGTGLGNIEKNMINFLKFLTLFAKCSVDLYLWRKLRCCTVKLLQE